MKKFSLFMAATLFFMIGCSNDDYNTELNHESSEFILKYETENTEFVVSVNEKIVEQYVLRYAGIEYSKNEVFENMFAISRSNIDYMTLTGSDNAYVDESEIDMALQAPEMCVASLPFSDEAKQKLMVFLNQKVDPSTDVSLLINDFTNSVRGDINLDENEKNIILIALQLSVAKGGEKDLEWVNTRGGIMAAVSGGVDSPAQAVLNAAVVTALTL
ncbi:hypothetical protein Q763_16215 [Flavobacterium beibuense F44-8]|uniref:Lipoprotein n=1 Tax=Flavobacterium beibuense F44-8 TaxID=1406840 RepID=A0A0A2LIB1_9FLAO|nr:hypothetical protein [Flavobacterium beibuense]KGO78933.1 hypothetical protein Q763_16215 [Flavobacterium beibuense F44-8]